MKRHRYLIEALALRVAFALLGLISLAISILAWSATPGAGV